MIGGLLVREHDNKKHLPACYRFPVSQERRRCGANVTQRRNGSLAFCEGDVRVASKDTAAIVGRDTARRRLSLPAMEA